MAGKARRTTMYSSAGKKLYAVRDKTGKFKDIQQYSRAHAMDMKRGSAAERAAKSTKGTAETAKKRAAKTTAAGAAGGAKTRAAKTSRKTAGKGA